MSEPNPKPNDELVPKADLEKAKTEAAQAIETMKQQVEEAKRELLSREYLEYLDEKKNPKPAPKGGESEEVKALRNQLAEIKAEQAQLSAQVELEQVVKAHPDFEDYRADIKKIFETSKTDITIEQAYFMAKGQKEKKPEAKPPVNEFSTERPGGIYPPPQGTEKTYKTAEEAGNAAAASVLAKYNISGGTI